MVLDKRINYLINWVNDEGNLFYDVNHLSLLDLHLVGYK